MSDITRKIKYIAETKEYFDKRNGNSYWSCRVEDIENDRMYVFPFQYGYGDHSEDVVKKALNIDDWGKKPNDRTIKFIKHINCSERTVKDWGSKWWCDLDTWNRDKQYYTLD